MGETKLAACPFCGSVDIYIEPDEYGSGGQHVPPYHVGCNVRTGCGAGVHGDTKAEAIAAWNRRAPVPAGPQREKLLRLARHALDDANEEWADAALEVCRIIVDTETERER